MDFLGRIKYGDCLILHGSYSMLSLSSFAQELSDYHNEKFYDAGGGGWGGGRVRCVCVCRKLQSGVCWAQWPVRLE